MTRSEKLFMEEIKSGLIVNPDRKMVDMLLSNEIIDNHTNEKFIADGIIVLSNGSTAPFYNGCYFCINNLYMDVNGVAHLSTVSVAGTVMPGHSPKERIIAYNDSLMEMFKHRMMIKEFHCKDYSIFF